MADDTRSIFVQQPKNLTVANEDSIAYFGCDPSPNRHLMEFWLEKNVEGRYIRQFNNRTATLPHGIQIYPLHISDSGRYRCVATDQFGSSHSLPTDLVVTSKNG